jgi:hypothetical protein
MPALKLLEVRAGAETMRIRASLLWKSATACVLG